MSHKNQIRATTLDKEGKDLAAAIMDSGANLNINQQLARDLAKLLVSNNDSTITSLMELLSQPDPHKVVKSVLRTKADEHLEDWATGDPADFAHWIISANLCFHAVHDLLRGMGDWRDVLTIHVVQGVRHYRESPEHYTDEQMKNFALIAAASEYSAQQSASNSALSATSQLNSRDQFSSLTGHDHFNCCPLSSQTINGLVLRNQENMAGILNVIVKHRVHTEEAIQHCLDGGHGSLIDGAL